ncbi:NADH-quinone oxidoreductase subunit C [Tepidiforma sp.]|uniref:NADH-quinone oxidoreductase subunit C n=1 Tax=Tepidiforma sp. TaxID=2682230 RepID=UPI002ADDAF87|nr:NADH-quinone oxidoreductase subunit C [Tepidiforma sp.]
MSKTEAPKTIDHVVSLLQKHLGKLPVTISRTATDANIDVAPGHFRAVIEELKNRREFDFNFLRNMVGIDMQEEGLACKYQLYSYRHRQSVQVTVLTPPGNPHIPSITDLYAAANWHEREAAEMVGLVFDGHPNLKNLLLDEDVRIHPLRKDHPLQKVEILQGIEDTTPGFPF